MLTPLWTFDQIDKHIQAFVDDKESKAVQILSFVGEEFVNDYRESGTYRDQTGNLRSSGGYFIRKGNKKIKSETPGDKSDGRKAAIETANSVEVGNEELALVGVAGMEYAEAVESRGREVITPMAQRASKILDELIEEL